MLKLIVSLSLLTLLIACEHPEQAKLRDSNVAINKAVQHPARPVDDVKRDKIRAPDKVLDFFDIKKGDTVLELLAADGYYTELVSRCVGKTGKVYMQNNQQFYDFQTDKGVIERLSENRLANVIRLDSELTNLKVDENSIDKLLMILVLHDFYWMEDDVSKVIHQIFNAIKPGGTLGIIDHAGVTGSGITQASDMNGNHRIDKQYVIRTMLEHGFEFEQESDALANPKDNGTKAFFSPELKGKPTNRFMLKFTKPIAEKISAR